MKSLLNTNGIREGFDTLFFNGSSIRIKIVAILFFFSFPFFLENIYSQENVAIRSSQVSNLAKTITGTIVDEFGDPLIGASVSDNSSAAQNGTITDIDGRFTLKVAEDAILKITYIGFTTQTVSVKGKTDLHIVMKEDSNALDEVVVTGYGGKMTRAKLTNSISTVDNKVLEKGVYTNPAQALSGVVPGLKVSLNSGNPTSSPKIVLRGGTNFDGTGSPLVIVDGQLRDNYNDINPQDIESMDVLKDAGATAIYGARASNGVILITTKTGKSGRSEINVKASVGLGYVNNPYDFLGAEDYINVMRTAYDKTPWAPKANLTGATPLGTGNVLDDKMKWNIMGKTDENAYLLGLGWQEMVDPLDPQKRIIFKDTNPADYNLRNPTVTQDYNISMSGGSDKGSYYASVGFNDSPGAPITTDYQRYNFTFNGSYKITNWLNSISKVSFSRAQYVWLNNAWGTESDYFGRVMSTPPTVRFEDEDGNPELGPSAGDGNQTYQAESYDQDNERLKTTLSQSFEINILEGLDLRASAMWYYDTEVSENMRKDFETAPGVWNTSRNTSASYARKFSQTYNVVADYRLTLADMHNFNAMVGGEFFDRYTNGFSASGSGAPTDDFNDLGLTDPGEGKRSIDSYHSKYRILSYFGRLNYDYDEKYLFSGVLRYDGYSSLLGDNRWGVFPGVSGGWVFTKENFIKEAIPVVSYGKLRASYGQNGNATGISEYELQGSYNSNKYNGNGGFLIGALPNPSLQWEKTTSFDIGLAADLFNRRLRFDINYYNRLTSNKYANLSLPSTTGFSSIKNNNGKYRNRGIEVMLSGTILNTKDIQWDAGANITYNKNIVVELPDNGLERNRQNGQQVYTGAKIFNPETGKEEYETMFVGGYQEGMEPGVIVGYQTEGIYQSIDDIPGDLIVTSGNHQGKTQYGPDAWAALTDAERAKGIELQPGDMKWKDINGDGMIDSYDQVVLGNTQPRWYGGFNTTFSWKGLSLYARFDYAFDYWVYDSMNPWFLGAMQGTYNTTTEVFNTWSENNTGAKYPRYVYADQLGAGNYNRQSDLFASKGNYIGIRELSLSYTLPETISRKLNMKRVQLSVTGQNLGYITTAKTVSPEIGSGYPLPRTVIFGANITF